MKNPFSTHYLSIGEAGRRLAERSLRSIDLVEACLERIESNKTLGAFITVLAEEARQSARRADSELDRGLVRSPLQGIPIAFKDMYDTAGIRTTAAFQPFANRIPAHDAAAVKILKTAGAVMLGKTNMHELAMGTTSHMSSFGPVRNPWNPEYISGGSSGGSAAAVSAGLCFATIDTDAIGSTRLPASCCGATGFKCSWGLMDNTGILEGERADPAILALAAVGIIARSAADVALVGELLAPGQIASRREGTTYRLGVIQNFQAEPIIRNTFHSAVQVLEEAGCRLVRTDAPLQSPPSLDDLLGRRAQAIPQLFLDADVLTLPTVAGPVPRLDAVQSDPQALSPQQTFFANYYGLPAISVPCGLDANGLPIGIQFVGKPGEDSRIIELAEVFQRAVVLERHHPIP